MATEQRTQQAGDGGVATAGQDTLTITDNRTGQTYEVEVTDGTVKAMDLRQIKVSDDDFGLMAYDPAFTNTASCRSAITYIDGEAGILQHRGYPIEQLLRALELPRGRLPARLRGAADRGPARALGLRHHPSHLRPRGHQAVPAGVPLRRPPDGHAAGKRRGAVHLLSRRQGNRRSRGALHGGDPDDGQGADAGRLRLPAQHGPPLRLPRQRPQLPGELPLDDVQEDRGQVRARPAAGARPRRAVHPPRRPRAELLDERGARGRLLAGGPVLGGGRRRRGALRAAPRGRQRGRAAHVAADRDGGERPRLPRGGQEPTRNG